MIKPAEIKQYAHQSHAYQIEKIWKERELVLAESA